MEVKVDWDWSYRHQTSVQATNSYENENSHIQAVIGCCCFWAQQPLYKDWETEFFPKSVVLNSVINKWQTNSSKCSLCLCHVTWIHKHTKSVSNCDLQRLLQGARGPWRRAAVYKTEGDLTPKNCSDAPLQPQHLSHLFICEILHLLRVRRCTHIHTSVHSDEKNKQWTHYTWRLICLLYIYSSWYQYHH